MNQVLRKATQKKKRAKHLIVSSVHALTGVLVGNYIPLRLPILIYKMVNGNRGKTESLSHTQNLQLEKSTMTKIEISTS